MSGGKPPFDPFPGSERTVIKPMPGGRPDAAPAPQYADDLWSAGEAAPMAPPRPAPSRSAPGAPAPVFADPSGARRAGADPAVAGEVPDANPIMRAARPLLLLLANLRVSPAQASIAPLMEQVAQAIDAFERELLAAGIPENQVTTAKYAMCATADDIVQNLPGSDRGLWTRYSMLSRFFQARTSGVGFFNELAKVKANPALNLDLLEMLHACLSLGFEGQYRAAGGVVALQQIRLDVYQTLRHIRARAGEDLSPHWRGLAIAPDHARIEVPAWTVAAAAGAVLLGVFVILRLLLADSSEALADRFLALHPDGEVRLARQHYEPAPEIAPVETTRLQRIRTALAGDIEAKRVAVGPAKKYVMVRLLNDVLFDTGSATVRKPFEGVLERVARALDQERKEPNRITVIGHTDNARLTSSARFKSNQELSEKRAETVAAILRPHLSQPDRFDIKGRGPDEPIAPNSTKDGRARNRRVDILIPSIN